MDRVAEPHRAPGRQARLLQGSFSKAETPP
jgi:hypothetical protein